MKLTERFDKLAALKRVEREAKAVYDAATQDRKDYESDLFALARDEGCFSIRTSQGQYSLKAIEYGTITDMEAFKQWAEGLDLADEFLKIKEQGARLNELVNASLEAGSPLPPGVGYYTRQYISVSENKED